MQNGSSSTTFSLVGEVSFDVYIKVLTVSDVSESRFVVGLVTCEIQWMGEAKVPLDYMESIEFYIFENFSPFFQQFARDFCRLVAIFEETITESFQFNQKTNCIEFLMWNKWTEWYWFIKKWCVLHSISKRVFLQSVLLNFGFICNIAFSKTKNQRKLVSKWCYETAAFY